MRRLALAIVAALAAAACASAADVILWGERDLTWGDFAGAATLDGAQSHMAASLDLVSTYDGSPKSGVVIINAVARMFPRRSYAGDSLQQTSQRLRYHQLQFDQLEIMRRRLQNDINTGMTGIDADNALRNYRAQYAEQIAAIDSETDYGRDDHKLQEWEYFTRKSLEEMGAPSAPSMSASDFSYGIFIGLGGLFPTGDISDYFNGCFTFTAGLTGGYKDLKLKALIEYGQPSFDEPNVFGEYDSSGRDAQSSINTYASMVGVSASIGYSVVNTKRFALTPHVGFYWSNYGWNVANLEWSYSSEDQKYVANTVSTEKKSLRDFSWMAGVDFDIKIHTYVSNTPFLFGQRERLTSMVRITPYIAHASYSKLNPAMGGCHIGFTVAYVGIAQALSLK